jgi:hypothetical protein
VQTFVEYPTSTIDGPDPEDMAPDLEAPRCAWCGHEITAAPVIRVWDSTDENAEWTLCENDALHAIDLAKRT